MANLQRRMESLEQAMGRRDAQVAWPEVGAALRRQQARDRLKVCCRLGLDPDDCCVREAAALLVDDTPALTAQDAAIVQRWLEALNCEPEIIALRRYIAVRQRYQQRHPFSGRPWRLLYMHCVTAGVEQGGRPPKVRRCKKRLDSRLCWNGEPLGRIAVTAMAGSKIAVGLLRGAPHAPGKT